VMERVRAFGAQLHAVVLAGGQRAKRPVVVQKAALVEQVG
jgi:biopolymer transport protein ExbB